MGGGISYFLSPEQHGINGTESQPNQPKFKKKPF